MQFRVLHLSLLLIGASLAVAVSWFVRVVPNAFAVSASPSKVSSAESKVSIVRPEISTPVGGSQRAEPTQGISFLGVILPRETTEIAATIDGKVIEMHVRIGEHVSQGDLVATLDSRLSSADFAAAQAAAKAERVSYDMAVAEGQVAGEHQARFIALADAGLASGEELLNHRSLDQLARLRIDAARANVAQRVAQAERVASERALMQVRAPFDGTIVARYVDPGALVSSNPPRPIARLISADRLYVRFAVPEKWAVRLRAGASIQIRVDASGVVLSGVIEKVAPEVDATSRCAFAEASIGQLDAGIVSGLAVYIRPEPAAALARSAIAGD